MQFLSTFHDTVKNFNHPIGVAVYAVDSNSHMVFFSCTVVSGDHSIGGFCASVKDAATYSSNRSQKCTLRPHMSIKAKDEGVLVVLEARVDDDQPLLPVEHQ